MDSNEEEENGMDSDQLAPLYHGPDLLTHACSLFLDNYGDEVDLRKWTLNAAQNMFIAGQNCQIEKGLGLSIHKIPLSTLRNHFNCLSIYEGISNLIKIIPKLKDLRHSYCIVGFFFCFRSHGLRAMTEDLVGERFIRSRIKLIREFGRFNQIYSQTMNGVRFNIINADKEFDDILNKLPNPSSNLSCAFETKKFGELGRWGRDFCRKYKIVLTSGEELDDLSKLLAEQNQLAKPILEVFCALLSCQSKEVMSVFGDNQENLMCLFKKVDQTLQADLIQQRQNQRISDLEAKIAELQSSSRNKDISRHEIFCLFQDGAAFTEERLRPKKLDKDPESVVNGSNIRDSNGRRLQECKECEQMKPHHGRGYCSTCYGQAMRKEKLCVKCKKAEKVEGKKVCSKCRDKYDNTKGSHQSSSKCKKCKERVKTRPSGLCEKCYRAELRSRLILCKSCKELKKNYSGGMCRSCSYKQKKAETHQVDQDSVENNIKAENPDNEDKTHPILQPKTEYIEVSSSSYTLPPQLKTTSSSNKSPSSPLKQTPITQFLSPDGKKKQTYEVIILNSDDDN